MSLTPQERDRAATTRVLLVNHGETEWSAEDRFSGASDVLLSARGQWQAEQLAERLASERVGAIYSSPLQRALQTAEMIAGRHALRPIITVGLGEMDFGDWEGRVRGDVLRDYAPVYGAWTRDPATVRTPRGESGYDVATRAVAAVKEAARAHAGQTIVVAGHRTVNRIVLCQLLGINLAGYRERLAQDPAALNDLEIDARGRGHLRLLNETAHLVASPEPVAPAPPPVADEAPAAGQGAKIWLVPGGYLVERPPDDRATSENALVVLNTGSDDARLLLDFFFEDRPEIADIPVTVAGRRTVRIPLDQPERLNGTELPCDVPFAMRVRSDHPIVVQYIQRDASPVSSVSTTPGYPVDDSARTEELLGTA
jgi:broad specificity phosphatase PhoE